MTIPRINGLLETSLYVADLERSREFYSRLFGFRLIHSEGNRMRALSIDEKQVLLLFRIGASRQATQTPKGSIPPHDGGGTLHLAFAIAADQLGPWRARLLDNGIAVESEVDCGGKSIYFRDPDGHLVELITPGCWPVY